ncbi:MAG TPA: DUF1622 domain-containing protein [Xanthomonadaceae bacterium]|nr:DUF1622 domain-containing protein [Xanthomonadaceae bacterium]
MLEQFKNMVEVIGWTLEGVGVLAVVLGSLVALTRFAKEMRLDDAGRSYHNLRKRLGRSIIIGLEFLIAGDIIRTVVVDHSLTSLASLAIVIALRTFLSMTLFLEVEGRWPWQRPVEDQAT